jgi:hypothetical protein
MLSPLAHSLPIAAVAGGLIASILAWASSDALTGLAVATGALFVAWLTAMLAAQYAPVPHEHPHHGHPER